ncbi:MAG: hypothetical protein ABI045_00650 [Flavobacteriales bacterium]
MGFAPDELTSSIDDVQAKIIITVSDSIQHAKLITYKPMIEEAIAKLIHKPEKISLYNRKLNAFQTPKNPRCRL